MRGLKPSPVSIDQLLSDLSNLEDGFDPALAVVTLRVKAKEEDSEMLEIICDLIEGLWDEVQRLRTVLDQSNVNKGNRK